MSRKSSFQRIIISVLFAVTFLIGGVFCVFNSPKIERVSAEESAFGVQDESGYYIKKGVVFYAIKVKKITGQKTRMTINPFSSEVVETNEYWPEYEVVTKADGTPYYINYNDTILLASDEYILISFARQLPTQTESEKSIFLIENQKATIDELTSAIENANARTEKKEQYIGTNDGTWVRMTIGENEYQVYYTASEGPVTTYTYSGKVYKILDGETDIIKEGGINTENFDRDSSNVLYNYYNSYKHSDSELYEGSDLTLGNEDRNYYIDKEQLSATTLSQKTDFLTVNLEVDGTRMTNTIVQGAESKQFGYILNLNDQTEYVNEEGLFDLRATYKVTENEKEISDTFAFNFYVFKESTYNNVNDVKRAGAPAVEINLSAINDPQASSFYSEYFYYYQRSEIPYLIYNHNRYEISINKAIHSTSSDYLFTYNQQTKEIDQTIQKGISTSQYYTQEFITQNLYVKKNNSSTILMYSTYEYGETIFRDNNGEKLDIVVGKASDSFVRQFKKQDGSVLITEIADGVFVQEGSSGEDAKVVNNYTRILFRDIAEYKISYSAVYYKDGSKTYLEALNESTLKDKITVFGWQLTYKDAIKGQIELKSTSGEIHSDFTPQFANESVKISTKKDDNNNDIQVIELTNILRNQIPSTNQPPAYFMFNSDLKTTNSYKIYKLVNEVYEADKYTYELEEQSTTSIYSFFTKTGKYLIEVDSVFNDFKSQSGDQITRDIALDISQYFIFEVTNTTPTLEMKKLNEDGEPTTENILNGKYVKYGVEIAPTQKAGIFDSTTRISVYKKAYSDVNYPVNPAYTIDSNDLNNTQITGNGNYKVVLEYGIYSASKDKYNNELISYFTIDNDNISGITAYNVEKISGSVYYSLSTDPNKVYTTLSSTNEMFSLFWKNKESGAKISAKYQVFPFRYKVIKDGAVANDYRLDNWVLIDYEINTAQTATIPYTKADTSSTIKANNILNDSGLYIFELTDEAGNVEYFSIIYDTTTPKILQKSQDTEEFVNVSRFNYISTNTEVFYGTHKAIKVSFGEGVTDSRNYIKTELFQDETTFLTHLFDENGNVDSPLFQYHAVGGGVETLYFTVPVTAVKKYLSGSLFKTQPVLKNMSNLLEIRYIDDDRIAEEEYLYYVYDQSNRTTSPSLVYKLTVSTDLSACKIYYETGKENNDGVSLYGTETSIEESTRYMYFRAISDDVTLLFRYKAEPSDVVSIKSIDCEYYALEYDALNRTYKYTTIPKLITLSGEVDADGYITCEIKMNSGYTSEGKYIIKRIYTEESRDEINQDYMIRGFVLFVDNEKEIISTPEGSDDIQTGAYDGMILFKDIYDANNQSLSVTFDELYRQNQKNSDTVVFTTNKLPISISIPYAKYGTVTAKLYDQNNDEILVSSDGMVFSITSNLLTLQDNMYFSNLDEGKTFYPYFTVARIVKDGVVEKYITVSRNGYISLSDITKPGKYTLEVGCIQDQNDLESGKYLQYFFFNFEVVSEAPSFELSATYDASLTQISSNKLEVKPDGYYYSNADNIVVGWTDPSDNFMAKINKSQISYSVGAMMVTLNKNQIIKDVNNENSYYFVINGPFQDGTIINITMQYEGQSNFYAANGFRTIKRIVIDKSAPTTNLAWVSSLDTSIAGVSSTDLRTVGDRYNKSNITNEKYKYYSYVFDVRKLTANAQESDMIKVFDNFKNSFLSSDNYLNTQKIYIQKVVSKYDSAPYESWLPIDPNAESNALFSSVTWKQMRDYVVDDYEESLYNYYEIVEIDSAGNMTIYTIYLIDSQFKVNYRLSYNAKGVDAVVDENGDYTAKENKKLLESGEPSTIYSRETFNINSIYFDALNSEEAKLDYNYYTIKIDGVVYYKTPFTVNQYVRTDGTKVNLNEIILRESTKIYSIEITNWLFGEVAKININVIGPHDELQYEIVRDTPNVNTIGIKLFYGTTSTTNSGVRLNEIDGIIVTVLNDENNVPKDIETKSFSETTIKYFTLGDEYQSGTVYVIKIKDNFNIISTEYVMYSTPSYQNFKGGADITQAVQNNKYVVSSETVYFYADSLYNVSVKRKDGFSDSAQFLDYPAVTRTDNGVNSYTLPAPSTNVIVSGYTGGRYEYLITKTPVSDSRNATEITVVIYNYMPSLEIKDYKGDDITDILNGDVITSNSVYIYFDNQTQEFPTQVQIVKRGGTDTYKTIATGHKVEDVGVYDIMISFKNLVFSKQYTFSISAVDVLYYSVILKDSYIAVPETGSTYVYTDGARKVYVPHHYIVNGLYEISKNNGIEVELIKTISVTTSQAVINTYIYDVSNYGSTTNPSYYITTIAVTSIPETTNILQGSFGYYKGDVLTNAKTTFEKSSSNVFLTQDDIETKITISFNGYYGVEQNKILYQIAKDGLWSDEKIEVTGNTFTLEINSSAQYQFRFFDKAGNQQVFSTGVGTGKSNEYVVNFVKSVIFNINSAAPIDSSVYNSEVVISVPAYTLEYYDAKKVSLVAKLNGEIVDLARVKGLYNTYSATESGLYEIYFTANRGSKALKEEVITFTIINPNDSRWAFEYINYNEYKINSIMLNGTDIKTSTEMKRISYSILGGGESVATKGYYTISISTKNAPVQTFNFSFWLNDEIPPISVSIPEGESTTGTISVKFNARNIYEMVGDCSVVITGLETITINKEYVESLTQDLVDLLLTQTKTYYIQVYTDSGKLVYSYRTDIVDPLNTVTIILIVVGAVVLVVGLILFFTLRKKMKIR